MRIRKISVLLLSVWLLMGITACKGGISETGSKAEASDSITTDARVLRKMEVGLDKVITRVVSSLAAALSI